MAEGEAAPIMAESSVRGALDVIREAVEVLRHKHMKKACAKHGSFVCIKEKAARKLAEDLEQAEIFLDKAIEELWEI